MYGHALELALKAFLLAKGSPVKPLKRKIGHDLEKLLNKTLEQGLEDIVSLSDENKANIRLLSKTYCGKYLEYHSSPLQYDLPAPKDIEEVVFHIIDNLKGFCFEATVKMR